MSDSCTVSLGKGRVPTVESLEAKIARIKKVLAKAKKLELLLPDLERKLQIVKDPTFQSRAETKVREGITHKADKVTALLKSLPPDMVAQILASLGK